MPAGGLVTAGIGAAVGIGESIYGHIQAKKLQAQQAANIRPTYQIPTEEQDIQNLALSRAGQGMSDAARTANQNQSNQGLAASLSAIKQSGDTSNIGGVLGAYNNAGNQLAIYDDQARMQNLNNLYSSYQRMSADKDKQFQLNQMDPYKDKAQFLSQQLQGAKGMEQAGINTATSGLMNLGSGLLKNNTNQNPTAGMRTGQMQSFSAMTPAPSTTLNSTPQMPSVSPGYSFDMSGDSGAGQSMNLGSDYTNIWK